MSARPASGSEIGACMGGLYFRLDRWRAYRLRSLSLEPGTLAAQSRRHQAASAVCRASRAAPERTGALLGGLCRSRRLGNKRSPREEVLATNPAAPALGASSGGRRRSAATAPCSPGPSPPRLSPRSAAAGTTAAAATAAAAAAAAMGVVSNVVVQAVISFVVLGSLKRAGVIRCARSRCVPPCCLLRFVGTAAARARHWPAAMERRGCASAGRLPAAASAAGALHAPV